MTAEERAGFGALIKEKRLELGMTRKELAQLLGTQEYSVRDWERGKNAPGVKILPRLSEVLKIPVPVPQPDGGNRIKALCASRGMTMKELAGRLGVQSTHLIAVAGGKRGASPEYARRVADALGCSVQDLGIRITRSTGNAEWQSETFTSDMVEKRDRLFEQYHWAIPECMKKYRLNIWASRSEPDDVYQTLACELCRLLYSFVQKGKENGALAHYIRFGLKMALLNYTMKADVGGVTHAPKDGSFRVVSIDAMLDAGRRI